MAYVDAVQLCNQRTAYW